MSPDTLHYLLQGITGVTWQSLVMLAVGLVLIGLAISGWQASPYLLHKTSFLVVVFGIPVLAAILAIAWRAVKPKVVANTGNKIESLWTLDGPRYSDVTPDDLDPADNASIV